MLRSLVLCFFLVLCLPLQSASGQPKPSSLDSLTHLWTYRVLSKKQIPTDRKLWAEGDHPPLVFNSDVTKYAVTSDSAPTPSAPTNVTIRYLNGAAPLVLDPRPDNDVTKRTVRLYDSRTGEDVSLIYVWPGVWSPDGNKLLIDGRTYGRSDGYPAAYSTWCIDLKTMLGAPVSRVGKGEHVGDTRFSPDSKFIIYKLYSGRGQRHFKGLFIENADGGPPRRLEKGDVGSPEWKHEHFVFPLRPTGLRSYPKHPFEMNEDWLDKNHFIMTVAMRTVGTREEYAVWIVDDHGNVVQKIPSVRVHQAWPEKRTVVFSEQDPDGYDDYWQIKY